MAVAAILMATAVPSLKSYAWNLRLKTAVETLRADLSMARNRAISMNATTVVCPVLDPVSTDELTCADVSEWHQGWMVFADSNADRQRQVVEPIMKVASATEFVNISSSLSRNALRFFPNGTAPGSNATVVFCDRRGAGFGRKISLSNSGRITVQTGGVQPRSGCN